LPGRRRAAVRRGKAAPHSGGVFKAYLSTLLLTLANPMAILSFAAMLAGIGYIHGAAGGFVSGVFIGSSLWWLLLSAVAARARRYMNLTVLSAINRASGAVIIAFGLHALARAMAL
jgi:putative LysE/RhtB family amino acid efflux pump